MPKAAMLSYNTFLRGVPNGWNEGNLFVIQNDNGQDWGAPQFGVATSLAGLDALAANGDQKVASTVAGHWDQLAAELLALDEVVIYVGDRGSEHTIKHAAEHGLDPAKAVFVLCNCNMSAKEAAIDSHGFGESRRVMCECGGQHTMRQMAEQFLATGHM